MSTYHQDLDLSFVSRQLEAVRSAALDPGLAPLKGRQLIPTNNAVAEGAESFTYRQYDLTGSADFVSDHANDVPTVNALASETTVKPYTIATSYLFSRQELLAAQFAGVPLDARKAAAARRAVEEKLDSIAKTGDTAHGLLGLANQTGTTTYTVPADGSGSSKLWSTKTGALIVRDMLGATNAIITGTYEVERPDTLLVPLAQYALIASTRYNDYDNVSILEAFLNASNFITQVAAWSGCYQTGAASADRMIVYRRDPDVVEHVIPAEFTMLPVESRKGGLEFLTVCVARTAGVVCYRPKAIAYGDGI